MNPNAFEIELEGRRVLVNPLTQEVRILDAAGATLSRERIQVAAGSIQGIFSSLHEVADGIQGGIARRNV